MPQTQLSYISWSYLNEFSLLWFVCKGRSWLYVLWGSLHRPDGPKAHIGSLASASRVLGLGVPPYQNSYS